MSKVYQKKWLNRLQNKRCSIARVCREIVADDSGHTDQMTQELAKIILERAGGERK